ncbi:P-type ATPase (P-ATPase) Superfamily Protein [Monocercomonoides exilis]|uniref:P-type ATPase (P-ATPase) Superfamily Protein n=1 Tax=Monocercomonoides exilis TaxID=2049356 RepID=UPI00355A98B3|nr:P-type ATPase (P-ATPase) Superfamily Protein [Monocercomonoides exilis]|eukprot:MONOS_11296.1-p1 / transcript=MONOS_11296.1 / gene=MONOS_11296 / organism=Monocercomonoides_exilis_PA203 / gene_product=P-type ATPase (P-ATPase) Superfamily Protein / transcript_product=P-type ATPase (P-ATPase) Superfamily Protein / location=Mono_scaffold00559:37518-41227(+) / protein_length=1145 / sequence_SO=supercontig / SO=protein_coding / is_pseudo=false
MENTKKLVRSPENSKHVELTSTLKGLTSQQATQLVEVHGYNEIKKEKPKSIFLIVIEALLEPMFIMLLVCLILYFVLGDWGEGIMLSVFVFFVIGLEVYQEKKTENAVHALRQLSSPRALVVRDGITTRIPGREVVPGDYVVLYEGDRVPADGVVLKEWNLRVDESLLTGESVAVSKEVAIENNLTELIKEMAAPGSEEANTCVYSGTLIVGGSGVVVTKATGMKTELGKIGKSLESVESGKTPLEREMGRLVIVMLGIGVGLSIAVLIVYGLTRNEDQVWVNAVLVAVALAMSLLPEEFPVVRSVFFALGAWRISKKNVLARKNRAIETLGAASVLCSDKTGTLTQNKMELVWLYIPREDAGAVAASEAEDENEEEARSESVSSSEMKRTQKRVIYKVHQRSKENFEKEKENGRETTAQGILTQIADIPSPQKLSASHNINLDEPDDSLNKLQTDSSTTVTTIPEQQPDSICLPSSSHSDCSYSNDATSEQTMENAGQIAEQQQMESETKEAAEAAVEPSLQTTIVQSVLRETSPENSISKNTETSFSPSKMMEARAKESYGIHLNLEELKDESGIPEAYHELVEYGVLASQQAAFDPMDSAINSLAKKSAELVEHLHEEWEMTREYPLSRKMLAVSQVWVKVHSESLAIAAKGAPEAIADLCHLPKEIQEEVGKAVEEMARHGLRVLGVARSEFVVDEDGALPEDQHDFDFEFMGLLGFVDPVREEVEESIKACHGAGIKVVMITGDYPGTAINIAQRVGIPSEEVVLGSELMLLEDVEEEVEKEDKKGKKVIEKKIRQRTPEEEARRAEIAERVKRSCIFARVVPEQKLALVNEFKRQRKITVMTGDGVNDAPALKSAHIGIAMGGQRGTDVAREAADLVLLDDSFSSIVHACRLGRRIYTNISKAVIYIISVHIPFAGLALFPIIFGWPVLLHPVHIVFSEILIDPACSVVFEMEPEEEDAFKQPPRSINKHIMGILDYIIAFGQGLSILACCLLLFFFNYTFNTDARMTEPVLIGMVFCCLLVSNMSIIVTNRSKRHSALHMLRSKNMGVFVIVPVAFMTMIFCLYVPGLRSLFHTDVIPAGYLFEAIGAGLITPVCFELVKALLRCIHSKRDSDEAQEEHSKRKEGKKDIEMGSMTQE